MIKQFLEEIKNHKKIILYRHQKPDGDAFGSQFGLGELIKDNFKNKEILFSGEEEELKGNYLNKIFKGPLKKIDDNDLKDALLIILDTANIERIEGIDSFDNVKNKVIKIDHHATAEDYGDIKIIHEKYSSTSEIISEIAEKSKWNISKKSAEYLLTGLITDSGRFMFSSVSENTLHQASILVKNNAKTSKLSGMLNDRDINFVRLQGKILSSFKVNKSVASYMMPKHLHKKFGVSYSTASSMIFLLMSSKEVKYGLFSSYDSKNKVWKVSIRSKEKPINKIAEKYSGGGHKMASGAKINGKGEFNKLLKELVNLSSE